MPAALNSLLDMSNFLVDMIMVGQISHHSLAAVAVGMQYMMLVYTFVIMFYTGINAVVSRYIGAGEGDKASVATFNIAWCGFLFSLPVTLIAFQYYEEFFRWISDDVQLLQAGGDYMGAVLFVLPLMFMRTIFVGAMSAAGDTRMPMKIKLLGFCINILLDYLLIFGHFGFPALGIVGAGLSTVMVMLFEMLALIYILLAKKSRVSMIVELNLNEIKRAMKVGIPASFERLFTFVSLVVFTKLIGEYGTAALAGYQVGIRVEGLAFMPGVGFMIASMALIGQSIGAQDEDEGQKLVLVTFMVGAAIMGFLGIFMIVIPETLAGIFVHDPETIHNAVLYLQIIGISQIPLAAMFILDGALRGAGATKLTLMINATSIWGLRVLPMYLLVMWGWPLVWIFWVLTLETFFRGWVFWHFFSKGSWKGIAV